MSVKTVNGKQMEQWVKAISATCSVYGVKARQGRFAFDIIKNAKDLRLDYDVTMLPPKKFFQPQCEKILSFGQDKEHQPILDSAPFVLFGVHPYDVAAISQMDQVFARDNRDEHYLSRRKAATIVACDVQNPSPNIFAACMGTAVVNKGFDILLTLIGDRYLVDSRTSKGDALMKLLPRGTASATAALLARREQLWEDNQRLLKRHDLKCKPKQIPESLAKAYHHPVWEEKARLCYSCGSCNLVCPTCYCFDMRDDIEWNLESGSRSRAWDGCMLTDFALVAGGHNFRKNRAERYRHRYYRKGKFLWDRIGQIACVGCGRCITACTAHIANPVEIFNTILEDK